MIQPAGGILSEPRRDILRLLCATDGRVAGLAAALGISESAVRIHLRALEDEGLVEYVTVRGGVGKPAHEYRLTPAAEALLSRAYLPFLQQVLAALRTRLDAAETERLFRDAGRGMVAAIEPEGDLRSRLDEAVRLVNALGGAAYVEQREPEPVIRGTCCPIAAIVHDNPLGCAALETALTHVVGLPVHADCDVSGRPNCRFRVSVEGAKSS
jgi:predicted ArsR family transcriptional regulator